MNDVISAIESARAAAALSCRALSDATAIPHASLRRILSGDRLATMPEIVLIADAMGCTVAQLTGRSVADRVEYAAMSVNGVSTDAMRGRLLYFMELDAYLDDQAIAIR